MNQERPPVKKEEPLKNEIKHFIDCVINNKEPLVDGKEGIEALEICIKALKAGHIID